MAGVQSRGIGTDLHPFVAVIPRTGFSCSGHTTHETKVSSIAITARRRVLRRVAVLSLILVNTLGVPWIGLDTVSLPIAIEESHPVTPAIA